MDKQKLLITVLIIIVIAFTIYTAKNFLESYISSMIDFSYSKGYADAVGDIISAAKNESCDAFPVFIGEDKVDIINVNCVWK
jgi:hypothetical protein